MDWQKHWENVYKTKKADQVSWFKPHLSKSLQLISETKIKKQESVIDIGGGASTLADDLLREGFTDITVLDISSESLETAKKRLGKQASNIHWIVDDITTVDFPQNHYALWHDRAVFHFLTSPADQEKYVKILRQSVKPQGSVILATFSLEGPEKCSGLNVIRYDAATLSKKLEPYFQLLRTEHEIHDTPFATKQSFIYCLFQKKYAL